MDEHRGTDRSEQEAARRMLAGLLAQRRLSFFDRLAARAEWRLGRWNAYWATLSRRGRRAMGRRLAPALLGASLLATLIISAAPVHAATITVDGVVEVADDGFCSLPESILNANNDVQVFYSAGECEAGSGADVITLTTDVTLTGTYLVNHFGYATGLPIIISAMTIEGNGHTIERDNTAPNFRILANISPYAVTLNDVTISGGVATPGGFSFSDRKGGGIHNVGQLILNNSTVTGNHAMDGGGIYNFYGSVTLNDSTVSYNSAAIYGYGYGRGGGIYNREGAVTLNNSTVSDNTAGASGGGVYVKDSPYIDGTLTMTESTVSDNFAFTGGGISNRYGTLMLTGSAVRDNNAAGEGGGIDSHYGSLTLTDSTVSGNSTGNGGGGIDNVQSTATLTGSTVSGNSANFGGGMTNLYSTMSLTNSTVSGNSSRMGGGGIFNSSSLTLTDSTVSDNVASYTAYNNYGNGGGIHNVYGGTVSLNRTIVSGNSALVAGDEVYNDTSSSVTAANDNVFGHSGLTNVDAFANFTPSGSDVTATSNGNDPTPLAGILDPLADNGGPTLTHALVSGSPAVDLAPAGPATDQRGYGRPVGTGFDAGAYEFGATAPGPVLFVSPRANGNVAGSAVKPQDILAHDLTTGDWTMHFDGSDVGVTRPLAAFTHLPDGSLLLALSGTQNLPGLNGVTANDVVRFVPSSLGDTTAGVFEWYLDGSDVGLSSAAEKIDALDALAGGDLLISTSGNALVPVGGGVQQKAMDEDLLAFSPTATGQSSAGTWALHFDGSTVSGLAAEDVIAAHLDESTGDLYLSVINGFTIGGVSGNGKDILKLSPSGGGYAVSRFWRGAENGFNINISGIDMD